MSAHCSVSLTPHSPHSLCPVQLLTLSSELWLRGCSWGTLKTRRRTQSPLQHVAVFESLLVPANTSNQWQQTLQDHVSLSTSRFSACHAKACTPGGTYVQALSHPKYVTSKRSLLPRQVLHFYDRIVAWRLGDVMCKACLLKVTIAPPHSFWSRSRGHQVSSNPFTQRQLYCMKQGLHLQSGYFITIDISMSTSPEALLYTGFVFSAVQIVTHSRLQSSSHTAFILPL